MALSDHFFRHEAGRIVAVLSKIFGLQNIDLVEDATQDALRRAIEIWRQRGVPENPSAWLMAAARNRALDIMRREKRTRSFPPEYAETLRSEWTLEPLLDRLTTESLVRDDQLRLMFSCCHVRLKEEAQVGLILHYVSGFSIREVAETYLTQHATVERRLVRAKKVLAASGVVFNVQEPSDFEERLPSVRRAIYLLFNQGFHGSSSSGPVQPVLCQEALRLMDLLCDHPLGATPENFAQASLLSFHAARISARIRANELIPLAEQDRSIWDAGLISRGFQLLASASRGSVVSELHLEAMIAAVHAQARSVDETDWGQIVRFYDAIMTIAPSPVVALNRAIAVAELNGPHAGIREILAISGIDRLQEYPFYWAALGEYRFRSGDVEASQNDFRMALSVARNPAEKAFFQAKIFATGGSAETA
jgi:RNA polymerase sigma-70 factor (ECF subfamily)